MVCRSQRKGVGLGPVVADVPEVLLVGPAALGFKFNSTYTEKSHASMQ